MTTEHFTLEPSPADPQPVKVFKLDDCTWWAGYSLQQCIDDARRECGADCFEDAKEDGHEVSDASMEWLIYIDDSSWHRSFAVELQRRIDAGEQFPQLFACTEG